MNSENQSTEKYSITGMTCDGCVGQVSSALNALPEIREAKVSLNPPQAIIDFEDQALAVDELNQSVPSKYQLQPAPSDEYPKLSSGQGEDSQTAGKEDSSGTDSPRSVPRPDDQQAHSHPAETGEPKKNLQTYWPLILVALFISGGTLLVLGANARWEFGLAMRTFMGLFFVVFSFFKFLDLTGFANAYRGYDWIAQKIPSYGYVYPFIELGLGGCYLLNLFPLTLNWITLVVMSISICGVVDSVLNKRKIKCACLGTGFNLPMSQVTIIEDGLMIAMAAAMIILLSTG